MKNGFPPRLLSISVLETLIVVMLFVSSFAQQNKTKSDTSVPSKRSEPVEMTPEIHDLLNNLPFPPPSGHFIMDGKLDSGAVLLSSNGKTRLYASVWGSQLYVATNPAQSRHTDMFLFVSLGNEPLRHAPWAKAGYVAGWSAFLANRASDNSTQWDDSSSSPLTNIVTDTVGTVLEGVVDIEYLTGISPRVVYLAVGKYRAGKNGGLLQQVPPGNFNGNIDPGEFYQFKISNPDKVQ